MHRLRELVLVDVKRANTAIRVLRGEVLVAMAEKAVLGLDRLCRKRTRQTQSYEQSHKEMRHVAKTIGRHSSNGPIHPKIRHRCFQTVVLGDKNLLQLRGSIGKFALVVKTN